MKGQKSQNNTQSVILRAVENLVKLIIIIMSLYSLFPGNRTWPHAHETEENFITITVRFWFPLIVLKPTTWYLHWIVMVPLWGYMRKQIRYCQGCLAPSHAFCVRTYCVLLWEWSQMWIFGWWCLVSWQLPAHLIRPGVWPEAAVHHRPTVV